MCIHAHVVKKSEVRKINNEAIKMHLVMISEAAIRVVFSTSIRRPTESETAMRTE